MLTSLNSDVRQLLLRTAREAILAQFDGEELPPPELPYTPEASGVFVTVHVSGNLRGCIGFLELGDGLLDTIAEAARRAAANDPRFYAVREDEMDDCHLEITLLGPIERIDDADDFEIGQHGLTLDCQGRRGLLLPQVPIERGWDKAAFLTGLCQKTRVPDRSWEEPAAILSRFAGVVIREDDAHES
ncbi:MAG: AmmeMemoRadiSam system protein A [Bacteroidota bacterium]